MSIIKKHKLNFLQNRNRTCNNPETAFGGIFCGGLSDEQVTISPTF